MKFLSSLLDKVSSGNKEVTENVINSFDDHLVLATCILLIEVAKSDDSFDDVERQKILSISKENFDLSSNLKQNKLLLSKIGKKIDASGNNLKRMTKIIIAQHKNARKEFEAVEKLLDKDNLEG